MKGIKTKRIKSKQEVGMIAENLNSRVELIQALIPLGLEAVNDLLQKEVSQLVGNRYERGRNHDLVRWGQQKSSVYLSDQKLSIHVPRIRDCVLKREIPLRSLERLQSLI